MLCTSLLLFNFQRSLTSRSAALSRDLVIIPLSFPFVKPFFKSFLKSFSRLVQVLFAVSLFPFAERACILYYALPVLSSTFFTFSPFSSFLVPSTIPMRHFIRLFGRKVYNMNKQFAVFHKPFPLFLCIGAIFCIKAPLF